MCGIVGILSANDRVSATEADLRRMLGAVRHRGPDEFGIYVDARADRRVGLGSARLSIIDLAGGQQPISNEDGTLWIIYNGEVFNYVELRNELKLQGHRFRTESDTEVIVHLYEQHGPECLGRLNGQFALAIWDERRGELFLARDRVGICPLYYARRGGGLVFASEIKALLAHGAVSPALDPVGIDQVFTYWSPLSPRTAFRDVCTLPPGHWLLATAGGRFEIRPYWQMAFPPAGDEIDDLDQAVDELRERLIDAVRLRLRSDVPVAAYLSGGLDSSTVTALVRHCTDTPLETFSVAFTDEAFDESVYQQRMADHLGTEHHLITCSHEDIGRAYPDVIWHAETPMLRTAPAPLYLLSGLVRRNDLKVVLTGEGADEFLAGYEIFKEAKVRRFIARGPGSSWRGALLKRLYPYVGDLARGRQGFLERFFRDGADGHPATQSHDVRWRNTARTKRLFSAAMRSAIAELAGQVGEAGGSGGLQDAPPGPLDGLSLPEDFAQWSPLARAQYLEATIFLPGYLMSSQGDRMVMSHSVEGRYPFLDPELIEFCNRLSPRLKLCGLGEKHVLKRLARGFLPESIHTRRKRPYRAPIHASFFPGGKPLGWVAEALSPRALAEAGCFDPAAVAMLTKKIERFGTLGETDNMALAGVLSTQLVYRQFVADYRPPDPLDHRDNVKTVVRPLECGDSSPLSDGTATSQLLSPVP
jgi:asparagine synthase (glutamine-hydrolysing)